MERMVKDERLLSNEYFLSSYDELFNMLLFPCYDGPLVVSLHGNGNICSVYCIRMYL